VKLDDHNKPIRYKARVVVRGFLQEFGVNYDETFAPVAKSKSIKMLLTLASQFDLELKQLDFETAFLNAPLTESVYVKLPQGYDSNTGKIWKLNKALYGLKQAPYEWNRELDNALVQLGYHATSADPCIYTRATSNGRFIVLSIYVDDTIILYHAKDDGEWLSDKSKIESKYKIQDLGDLHWILNMRVIRNRSCHTIILDQEAYIEKLLMIHNMTTCKSVINPSLAADLTRPKDATDVSLSTSQHALFRSIVGGPPYAANMTRIDIGYSVGVLCRQLAAPTERHLTGAKHVLIFSWY
jgi:hypothetical protein